MATTRNLFGDTVAEALRSLIGTLTRVGAVAANNPERVVGMLKDLKANEGAACNLRGALFEMIIGYLDREIEGNTIDIGGDRAGIPSTADLTEIGSAAHKGTFIDILVLLNAEIANPTP